MITNSTRHELTHCHLLLRLVSTLTSLLVILGPTVVFAQWEQITQAESEIVFDHPDFRQAYVIFGKQKLAEKANVGSGRANVNGLQHIMKWTEGPFTRTEILYRKLNSGRIWFTERKMPSLDTVIRQIYPSVEIGRKGISKNEMGGLKYQRFTLAGNPRAAECVYIRQFLWTRGPIQARGGGNTVGKGLLQGWFCLREQVPSTSIMAKFIEYFESLRIREYSGIKKRADIEVPLKSESVSAEKN